MNIKFIPSINVTETLLVEDSEMNPFGTINLIDEKYIFEPYKTNNDLKIETTSLGLLKSAIEALIEEAIV